MVGDLHNALSEMYDYHVKLVKADESGDVVFAGVDAARQCTPGMVECVVISLPIRSLTGVSANRHFDWRVENEVFQLTSVKQLGAEGRLFLGQGPFGYEIALRDGVSKRLRAVIPDEWYDRYY